ncbi:uncharacterized protein LOC134693590 [Mytilus trossulus]|uniref:uncharacterized protein LOC134693590 n=1 Tax=Mytilus trossulus TaxID=6551 RepID=UPI003007A8DC
METGASMEIKNMYMDKSETDVFIPQKQRMCFFNSNDLSTERGQHSHMLKIILLAIIPVFVLLIQSSIYISNDSKVVSQQKSVRDNISFSVEIGLLVHYLQLERGATALYISSGGSNLVLTSLESNRLKTDIALDSLTKWISVTCPTHFLTRKAYQVRLQDYRKKLEPTNTTIKAAVEFYSNDNDVMIDWVGLTVKDSESETTWQELTAYHMLLLSKEQAGIERAVGSTFFARGSFSVEELLWYTEKKILGATYLERSMQYSTFVRTIIDDEYTNTHLSTELVIMREKIIANNSSLASVAAGILWFDNMTQYINILKDIQDGLAQNWMGYVITIVLAIRIAYA